jgi:hypothetical protein
LGNGDEKDEDIQEDYSAEEISIATQIVSILQPNLFLICSSEEHLLFELGACQGFKW